MLTANNPVGFFSTSGNQRFPLSLMTIMICVCHLRMSRRRPNQLDHEPITNLRVMVTFRFLCECSEYWQGGNMKCFSPGCETAKFRVRPYPSNRRITAGFPQSHETAMFHVVSNCSMQEQLPLNKPVLKYFSLQINVLYRTKHIYIIISSHTLTIVGALIWKC